MYTGSEAETFKTLKYRSLRLHCLSKILQSLQNPRVTINESVSIICFAGKKYIYIPPQDHPALKHVLVKFQNIFWTNYSYLICGKNCILTNNT